MDRLSRERRSWNMSRIRSGNTQPEIAVRKTLHALGYRFSLDQAGLPGKPDIVLARHQAVIFVHGCFWHRHECCRYAYKPKCRSEFWENKFLGNVEQDRLVAKDLTSQGWRQLVVWECQTRDRETLEKILTGFIGRSSGGANERLLG